MKMSDMIKQALDKKGLANLKDASKALGISPEILRVTIHKGHIPKDSTLSIIAKHLDLDRSALILIAHQEKVPDEVKGFFLTPTQSKLRQGKRVYPLSQEQCDYLEKIISKEEIQLIRKIRQVSEEAKLQIIGYVDFMFQTKKAG
jgi:DNA-binding MarR family transcriptional regulator